VLDGDAVFGPRLLWPNGWMIKTALGTEVDLNPGHIVLDGESSAIPAKGAQQPLPLFGPCLLWPRSPILATAELLLVIMSLFSNAVYQNLVSVDFCAILLLGLMLHLFYYGHPM